MVTVKVLKPFYDLVEKVDREVGESFDAADERGEEIKSLLPDYVEVKKKAAARKPKAAPKE